MGNEISVRLGEMKDADVLAQANIAMAWETEQKRLEPATIARGVRTVLSNPLHGFYVIAEKDGQTAGSLLVTFEWSDWRSALIWWVQSVYVQPAFRRCGVFKKLYEFVETRAAQRPRRLRNPSLRRAIQPYRQTSLRRCRHARDNLQNLREAVLRRYVKDSRVPCLHLRRHVPFDGQDMLTQA